MKNFNLIKEIKKILCKELNKNNSQIKYGHADKPNNTIYFDLEDLSQIKNTNENSLTATVLLTKSTLPYKKAKMITLQFDFDKNNDYSYKIISTLKLNNNTKNNKSQSLEREQI